MPARFLLTEHPLAADEPAAALAGEVETGADGAIVQFVGVARRENVGRQVDWLEYEAYEPLAREVFARIGREAQVHWPAARLAIHHRTGRVVPGDPSIVIAAASPHRAEAFAACRFAIERIKQIAPIWKHEFFAGGDVWIEGATADPDSEAALAEAVRRACE